MENQVRSDMSENKLETEQGSGESDNDSVMFDLDPQTVVCERFCHNILRYGKCQRTMCKFAHNLLMFKPIACSDKSCTYIKCGCIHEDESLEIMVDRLTSSFQEKIFDKFCHNFLQDRECRRRKCIFAHSLEEISPLGCKDGLECFRRDCPYIHDDENVRDMKERLQKTFRRPKHRSRNYNSKLCNDLSKCTKEKCTYAHSIKDLRPVKCNSSNCDGSACEYLHGDEGLVGMCIRLELDDENFMFRCQEEKVTVVFNIPHSDSFLTFVFRELCNLKVPQIEFVHQ